MELGRELEHAMYPKELFHIKYLGPVTDTVVVTWIIMAFLIAGSFFLTRKLKTIPEGRQNFVEVVVGFINNFSKNMIGHRWKPFAPYLGTVLIFLIVSNGISLFNIFPTGEQLYKLTGIEFFSYIPGIHLRPPTRDINVPVSIAIVSMITVIAASIRFKKVSGWLKSFIEPMPLMLPMNIMEYFIRPFSLSVRLFGNILGAFIVMELIYLSIPAVLPVVPSIFFDLFDGILQAYIFVFLTSIYIGEAVE